MSIPHKDWRWKPGHVKKALMEKIGIVANTQSPLAAEAVARLVGWLRERKIAPLLDQDTADAAGLDGGMEKSALAQEADLVVVLGGDGTLIGLSRLLEGRKAPVLGVNLGSLGFLTEFTLEDMFPALEKVLNGDFTYEDRIMLAAEISFDGKKGVSYTALNDVLIHRGSTSQLITVRVEVNGELLNHYTSDGLIISTPTGSTAYNLSANGPIVYPSLNAIIITPICPQTLSIRPIVIPDNVTIRLSVTPRAKGNAAQATLDGQVVFGLDTRSRITIRRSEDITRIIQSPYTDYYNLLRGKLRWGE